MTDEERRKLCRLLRLHGSELGEDAANEIERLAADVEHWKMIANRAYIDPKPLAQSDAEPDSKLEELVSQWEALKDGGGPNLPLATLQDQLLVIIALARKGLSVPPRPDASAGLIEALEHIKQRASETTRDTFENDVIWIHEKCRQTLRARAADRSGK